MQINQLRFTLKLKHCKLFVLLRGKPRALERCFWKTTLKLESLGHRKENRVLYNNNHQTAPDWEPLVSQTAFNSYRRPLSYAFSGKCLGAGLPVWSRTAQKAARCNRYLVILFRFAERLRSDWRRLKIWKRKSTKSEYTLVCRDCRDFCVTASLRCDKTILRPKRAHKTLHACKEHSTQTMSPQADSASLVASMKLNYWLFQGICDRSWLSSVRQKDKFAGWAFPFSPTVNLVEKSIACTVYKFLQ